MASVAPEGPQEQERSVSPASAISRADDAPPSLDAGSFRSSSQRSDGGLSTSGTSEKAEDSNEAREERRLASMADAAAAKVRR
jgi:hypothetical protein